MAHRRCGKTLASIHDTQKRALCARDDLNRPRYAIIAPYLRQAKALAWDYLREASAPLRDLGVSVNESELRIDYYNGAQIRLYGADNADSLRGLYLDGVVCDEVSQFDPNVWPEIIRPALSDRKGWAVFIGTPKGHNSFYEIHKKAVSDPANWYAATLKASETGLLDEAELEDARKTLSPEQYAQEYECSFDAAIVGAFYGKLMAQAESESRITSVPREPTAQVWTAWDLGHRDATAIWFAQVVGREIRIIDYYESSGADLAHYVNRLQDRRYNYAGHIVPHDAQAKELGTGKSRLEVLESLGLRNVTVCPNHRVEDGINAVRVTLPKCWFDRAKCERGIEALKQYRQEYDDKLQSFRQQPLHDWASHAADAFRYLCMNIDRGVSLKQFNRPIKPIDFGFV